MNVLVVLVYLAACISLAYVFLACTPLKEKS